MGRSDGKILIISQEHKEAAQMAAFLSDKGYAVRTTYTGNDGIRAAEVHEPDVILLGTVLPDMAGLDICRNLRLRNTTWSIPIILLATGPDATEALILRGLELGAHDYVRTTQRMEVVGRVGVMLRMKRVEEKLRRLYIERTRELEWSNMELQKIRTQLILKNQMSTLGMMVAVAAHEIRSPAASISGNLELVLALLRDVTHALQSLSSCFSAADRESQAELWALMEEMTQRNLGAPPLDLKSRRTERARIEGALASVGWAEGRPMAAQLAKFRLGDPPTLKRLAALAHAFGAPSLDALFKMGELIVKCQNMQISIERINAIVRAMKSYTHVDQKEMSEFYLHEGLDDTLTIMGYIFKGGVEVERRYHPGLKPMRGHPGELNQVWTNILQNAFDAIEGKGQILVETDMETGHGGDLATVRITDDGGGIPSDVLPHIFDSFFTTKDKGRGSGLGLDICKRIVEKHGGSVEVDSRPGRTCFTIRLPMSPAPTPQRPQP